MYVQRNIEASSCYHCCSGKAMSIIHSECLSVALDIQHAMRMRHAICGLAPLQNFPTLSQKTARFSKNMLLSTKFVFCFSIQLLSEAFLILKIN